MTLINKSLIDSYYHEIRFYLEGYRDFIEPLKYILKYTYNQINSSLKIDLKVIIRFIDKKNKILPQNPKHFQLLYKLSFLSKAHKFDQNKKYLFDSYNIDIISENNFEENKSIKDFQGVYLSK